MRLILILALFSMVFVSEERPSFISYANTGEPNGPNVKFKSPAPGMRPYDKQDVPFSDEHLPTLTNNIARF